jgi:hypothetical protein
MLRIKEANGPYAHIPLAVAKCFAIASDIVPTYSEARSLVHVLDPNIGNTS